MYFFKIKYKHLRTYKTERFKTTIAAILCFLSSLPFSSLKNIEKITIERITDET